MIRETEALIIEGNERPSSHAIRLDKTDANEAYNVPQIGSTLHYNRTSSGFPR